MTESRALSRQAGSAAGGAPTRVAFRADASVSIGTGHVMRCLTLAKALRSRGSEVSFLCRALPGNCCELLEESGFPVFRLPDSDDLCSARDAEQSLAALGGWRPDWLIVDHYGLDRAWERRMRPLVKGIMAIDDLADRPHDCDLLLDQNLYRDMELRYDGLLPASCRQFLGPRHALLREEFLQARSGLRQRDGVVRRMVLFFGGSDPSNETEKALAALDLLDRRDLAVDVVVGSSNPNGARIGEICLRHSYFFHRQVSNMAELMAAADLALGAGGSTIWERSFLRLPAIVWITADNQRETTETVAATGALRNLGDHREVTVQTIADALREALDDAAGLLAMGERCAELMSDSDFVQELADLLATGEGVRRGE